SAAGREADRGARPLGAGGWPRARRTVGAAPAAASRRPPRSTPFLRRGRILPTPRRRRHPRDAAGAAWALLERTGRGGGGDDGADLLDVRAGRGPHLRALSGAARGAGRAPRRRRRSALPGRGGGAPARRRAPRAAVGFAGGRRLER